MLRYVVYTLFPLSLIAAAVSIVTANLPASASLMGTPVSCGTPADASPLRGSLVELEKRPEIKQLMPPGAQRDVLIDGSYDIDARLAWLDSVEAWNLSCSHTLNERRNIAVQWSGVGSGFTIAMIIVMVLRLQERRSHHKHNTRLRDGD